MMLRNRYQLAIASLWLLVLLVAGGAAQAMPAADRLALLQRGVNITHWFRFPPSRDAARLRSYLNKEGLAELRRAGFTFVRLPVQPEIIDGAGGLGALVQAIRRIQAAGLAVVAVIAPSEWHLETSGADREALFAAWRKLAPRLRGLPAGRTFPELLNEPVFPNDAAGWARFQEELRAVVRAALPDATLVLTGNDWGSVDGLLALTPGADGNVVFSVHYYEPPELTSLAAWRSDVNRAVLGGLPFPAENRLACAAMLPPADSTTAGVWRFYCAMGWKPDKVRERLGRAAEWGRRNGAAVLLGEFGASTKLNAPARLAWLRSVRGAAEQMGMGWALWGYDDVMGFDVSVPPPARPMLDWAVSAALGLGR